jgi:hypothetical protein
MATQNLLVVDFDYFFPIKQGDELYDWSHSETMGFMLTGVWVIRAAQFDRAGVTRPRMNNEWIDWWERFKISDDATLYYGDSNVLALREEVRHSAAHRTAQVWLFDAHHDSGYRENRDLAAIMKDLTFSCEDWMVGYKLLNQSELHVRYPDWKAWAMTAEPKPLVEVDRQVHTIDNHPDVVFDTVFVCRSGGWTPPWCDHDFTDFITDAPVNELYELGECEPRDWDEEQVKRLVIAETELIRRVEEERNQPS